MSTDCGQSVPDIFILVEEQSVSWVGDSASASLRAGAGALSKDDHTKEC